MPIVDTDILYKLSTTAGAAGNSTAQGDPNASFGKYISTTEINLGTPQNNLFDDVSGDENAASDVEYRCVFVHNSHGTLTLQNAVVWIQSEVPGGTSLAIAVDSTAASAIGSATPQALEIADEGDSGTALSGLTFSSPVTKGAGLSIGNLAAGECRAFWVRRTAANTAAVSGDGGTFRVEGDTAA